MPAVFFGKPRQIIGKPPGFAYNGVNTKKRTVAGSGVQREGTSGGRFPAAACGFTSERDQSSPYGGVNA
jgi:hypothetical protein